MAITIPTKKSKLLVESYFAGAERGEYKLPGGKTINVLGSGVEGVVFQEKNQPDVVKVMAVRGDFDKNAYLKYIMLCRRYASTNPYLPRVSQTGKQPISKTDWEKYKQIIADDDPDQYYHYSPFIVSFKLEKLQKLKSLNDLQKYALYIKTFGSELNEDEDRFHINDLFKVKVKKLFDNDYFTKDARTNADPLLVKALDMIKAVKRKTDAVYDLHGDNMMVRYSVGGPHLVLTDPLYS
jgi:hypothetical protein